MQRHLMRLTIRPALGAVLLTAAVVAGTPVVAGAQATLP